MLSNQTTEPERRRVNASCMKNVADKRLMVVGSKAGQMDLAVAGSFIKAIKSFESG